MNPNHILIVVIITAVIVWILKDLMFKCLIEKKSKDMSSLKFWGETYHFMTQDQIQNACKSIIKSFPETLK